MENFYSIIFFLLVISFLYVTVNSIRKQIALESYIYSLEEQAEDNVESWEMLLQSMRELDSKEMFEKDDEVGLLFLMITRQIEKFYEQQTQKEEGRKE